MTGSTMQNAALLWHVSLLVPPERKGSRAWAPSGLVRIVPIVVFSPDQWRGRRCMGSTQADALPPQTGSAAVTLGLAWLTFRGVSVVWPIYALAALSSAVGAFDLPARQALLPTLVPREHLPNAISLNTTMMQTASVAGPAVGGLMIAATGLGWAYVANAISFGFVILALLAMREPARDVEPSRTGQRDDVSLHAALEGLRFVFRSPLIRSTMLLDFFATFFSSATALLPIYAQDILHVGAQGYGFGCTQRRRRRRPRHERRAGAAGRSTSNGAGSRCSGPLPATARRPWCSACRGRSG